MKASRSRKPVDLDKALTELEAIVEQLEAGDQPLEKSLKDFERGVRLSRECQGALKDAEQRVQVLLGDELTALDGPAAEDEDDGDDGLEDEAEED
jgi:exodeoxyribonuclease VII small subunit